MTTGRAPAPEAARVDMTVTGSGFAAGMRAFLQDRAARLSLRLELTALEPDRATLRLHGHPALVDMFEVACLLGPPGALVHAVETAPAES